MTTRSDGQGWVLDSLMGGSGFEVLHPEARYMLETLGYDPNDFNRVLKRTGNRAMFTKAWTEVGLEVERKGKYYEETGYRTAARDVFNRAALLFGRGQMGFPAGDPRKAAYRAAVNRCVDGVIRNSSERIERISLPFENGTLHAIAHLPQHVTGPIPLVLLLPGMDMVKEDWTVTARQVYLPRGIAALAVDGPGQGETRANGVPVTIDNYERAMSLLIDHMVSKGEIDEQRIGLYGTSMGSYWGLRTAAHDPRIKGAGTAMGCYGQMEIIFERAQPSFKANYMAMAGYTDEQLFDAEFVPKMGVAQLVDEITCPVLMQYGEFDELSSLAESMSMFDALSVPRRLTVFEQEFHSLGGVGGEAIAMGADWLELVFAGELERDVSQAYVQRDGRVNVGDALPSWYLGEAPFARQEY